MGMICPIQAYVWCMPHGGARSPFCLLTTGQTRTNVTYTPYAHRCTRMHTHAYIHIHTSTYILNTDILGHRPSVVHMHCMRLIGHPADSMHYRVDVSRELVRYKTDNSNVLRLTCTKRTCPESRINPGGGCVRNVSWALRRMKKIRKPVRIPSERSFSLLIVLYFASIGFGSSRNHYNYCNVST